MDQRIIFIGFHNGSIARNRGGIQPALHGRSWQERPQQTYHGYLSLLLLERGPQCWTCRNDAFEVRPILDSVSKSEQSAQAVPIQEVRHIGKSLVHPVQKLANIFHICVKGGRMPAWTTRFAMSAQVEADQGITSVCQCFTNMGIARGVLTESMNKCDQRLGVLPLWLPALQEKIDPILVFPLVFKTLHAA